MICRLKNVYCKRAEDQSQYHFYIQCKGFRILKLNLNSVQVNWTLPFLPASVQLLSFLFGRIML